MNAEIFFTSDENFDRIINSLMGRIVSAERQEFELEEFTACAPEDDIYPEMYRDDPEAYILKA